MEESTQQLIALGLVALIVIAEVLRRQRKRRHGKSGCEGCDTAGDDSGKKEAPVKFYRRK